MNIIIVINEEELKNGFNDEKLKNTINDEQLKNEINEEQLKNAINEEKEMKYAINDGRLENAINEEEELKNAINDEQLKNATNEEIELKYVINDGQLKNAIKEKEELKNGINEEELKNCISEEQLKNCISEEQLKNAINDEQLKNVISEEKLNNAINHEEELKIAINHEEELKIAINQEEELKNAINEEEELKNAINDEELKNAIVGIPAYNTFQSNEGNNVNKKRQHNSAEEDPPIDAAKRAKITSRIVANINRHLLKLNSLIKPQDNLQLSLVVFDQELSRCKIMGTEILCDIIRKHEELFVHELIENITVAEVASQQNAKFRLPPLRLRGIAVNIERMTQSALRQLIPQIVRISTGKGRPKWTQDAHKPVWWPEEVPFASVRVDSRKDEQKELLPWTRALQKIVFNCYMYHGREDLLWPDDAKPPPASEFNVADVSEISVTEPMIYLVETNVETTVQLLNAEN